MITKTKEYREREADEILSQIDFIDRRQFFIDCVIGLLISAAVVVFFNYFVFFTI
jgi:hypothetical protein